MKEYPINKYRFHVAKKIDGTPYGVIAVSTYEGKTVRGVAKCDPQDTFNMEKGRELAAARCNQKVAMKRRARAERELQKAITAYLKAQKHAEKMNTYYEDSRVGVENANARVDKLLAKM